MNNQTIWTQTNREYDVSPYADLPYDPVRHMPIRHMSQFAICRFVIWASLPYAARARRATMTTTERASLPNDVSYDGNFAYYVGETAATTRTGKVAPQG